MGHYTDVSDSICTGAVHGAGLDLHRRTHEYHEYTWYTVTDTSTDYTCYKF